MGDHFVLLMDRLLTESTLVAAIESRNRFLQATSSNKDETSLDMVSSSHKIDFGNILNTPTKMAECRICQDEDEDRNMETPCLCCGSLKYAHRRCVQRWCNEKGNTKCEICHQQFRPGYTAPLPLFQFGRIPMSFRGNWEVYRRETPNGSRLIAMVSTDRDYSEPEPDEHSTSRSVLCCRFVALIFMILLILRHTLPFLVTDKTNEYSFTLLTLFLVRTVVIILPIYIIVRVLYLVHHRHRHQQVRLSQLSSSSSFGSLSDEEIEVSTMQLPSISSANSG